MSTDPEADPKSAGDDFDEIPGHDGPSPTLTPEEEAEAQRLYAKFLDGIAKGNTWGLNPKDDR